MSTKTTASHAHAAKTVTFTEDQVQDAFNNEARSGGDVEGTIMAAQDEAFAEGKDPGTMSRDEITQAVGAELKKERLL